MKYFVGQRVKVISYDDWDVTETLRALIETSGGGLPGVVIQFDGDDYINIEFGEYIGGHEGDGTGREGCCWGFDTRHIIPCGTENYGEEDD